MDDRFPNFEPVRSDADLSEGLHGTHVSRAVENLYEAFKGASLDDSFELCFHCFTEDDRAYLMRTPIRQLTYGDVNLLLGKLGKTAGKPRDFNHFLPRILEAMAVRGIDEPAMTASLLKEASLHWNEMQRRCVREFVRAYFAAIHALKNNAIHFSGWTQKDLDDLREVFPEIARSINITLIDYDYEEA